MGTRGGFSAVDLYELRRTAAALLPRRLRRGAYAEPPFIGYLERPRPDEPARDDLPISGWLFSRGSLIQRLTAAVDGLEIDLEQGLRRPDIAAAFPGESRAGAAGFRGAIPCPVAPTIRLQIWAHLATGRRLAFECRLARAARRPTPAPTVPVVGRAPGPRVGREMEALLVRAAGTDFPAVARSSAAILSALVAELQARGKGLAPLEAALRPLPPNAPAPEPTSRSGPRRILFVSGMFPSVDHGGGLRLFDLVQQLGRRHEIDLYALYSPSLDDPSLSLLRPSLRAARLVQRDWVVAEDVERWLSRIQRPERSYDVVHFEYEHSVDSIPQLRQHGRRSFFTMMESLTLSSLIDLSRGLDGGASDLGARAATFLRSYDLERRALAQCHQGIAVNEGDAAFTERCFGIRPAVIPTCVSEFEILRDVPPDRADDPASIGRTAVFVGSFDHPPNQEGLRWYLDHVHPLVRARVPGYQLRVVGRGSLSLLQLRYRSDPSVVFVGGVDELVPALLAGRVGLAPLISGAGIRGKINQYLAVGRPVVSTSIGVHGMPYRDGESIFVADSPERFADSTIRLLTEDDLWRRLRDQGRAVAHQHFRWAATIARLESLYDA